MAKTTTTAPSEGAGDRGGRGARRIEPGRSTDVASRRPSPPSILTFFQESRSELRKVTWPTREETLNLTIAVIAMTVGIAAFLGLIDTGLDQLVSHLIG